jgi:hypothetical protein
MESFIRYRGEVVMVVAVVGALLVIGDLLVAPTGTAVPTRLTLMGAAALAVPVCFLVARWVLGLVRGASRFCFWFFCGVALVVLTRSPFVVGTDPLAVPFLAAASLALGALAAHSKTDRQPVSGG